MPSTDGSEEIEDSHDGDDFDFNLEDLVADSKAGTAVKCGRNYIEPSLASVVIKSYKGERNEDGFFHGEGKALFTEGHVYEGPFVDGHMHGDGKLEFDSGLVYNGEFATDEITGTGELQFLDGSIYNGRFEKGVRHGLGIHTTGKYKFHGHWVDGIREGYGMMTYPNRVEFHGLWENSIRNGVGRMRYSNSNLYCGDFVNGRRHGKGVYYWSGKREVYTGEWRDGEMHGHGEHRWLLGTTRQLPLQACYVGSFQSGQREGHGVMTYSNGTCYDGEWHKNLKHGFGTFTSTNGVMLSGTFKENSFEEKLPEDFMKLLEAPSAAGPAALPPQNRKMAMKCLVTGGSRPKPVSQLNYLLGDIGVQGCKNIELSHTYNSAVSALLHGQDSEKIEQEMIEIHTVILKYIDQLHMVYDHYARLDRTPAELYRSHMMVRNQLWALSEDMKLHYDRTLADIDRLTWTGVMKASTIHDPDLPVPLRDFLEWITYLAVHLYRDHESCKSSRFLLASCLDAFLRNDLGKGACANTNPVYGNPSLRDQGIRSKEFIRSAYDSLCHMSPGFRRPAPKIKGEQQLPSANDFMLMMKKFDLYDDRLTPSFAVEAITWLSPSAIHEPQHPNMDEPITLHQFFTAIVLCAAECNETYRPPERSPQTRAAPARVADNRRTSRATTSTLDRYAQLFQSRAFRSASEGSVTSLDGTTSSRLSATPSQAGNTTSSLSPIGAAPSGRVRGSVTIVDSPVPEVVTETSLAARSNASLTSTQSSANGNVSQENVPEGNEGERAAVKWKEQCALFGSSMVGHLENAFAVDAGLVDKEDQIDRDLVDRISFFLEFRFGLAFKEWKWSAEDRP